MNMNILHLQPFFYAHIKDKIENIVFTVVGPTTYVLKSYEEIVIKETEMIKLKPNTFIRIKNPVCKKNGVVVNEILNDKPSKLAKVRFGDEEVRAFNQYSMPFPLYPGEEIVDAIKEAIILTDTQALRLVATRNFMDPYFKVAREVGNEWILPGPLVYIDLIEADVCEQIDAKIIKHNLALRVKAKKDFKDRNGVDRISGEEWIIRKPGLYIPSAAEEIVKTEIPYLLSDTKAIILEATSNFVDIYGIQRNVGQKWTLTNETTGLHIPDVYEKVLQIIDKIILNKWQYCRIMNPYRDGAHFYGAIEIRKGVCSFFLQPDEVLVNNKIEDVEILSKDEALLVMCKETFTDEDDVKRTSGERWLIKGPRSYIPSVEIDIIDRRSRIYLSEFEGIYVRDIHSGDVKLVTNTSYLLEAHEELWNKQVPREVELLLQGNGAYHIDNPPQLLKTIKNGQCISFTVPHNAVTQIFDFKLKKSKIVFGPELVMLQPHEHFTVLDLSGNNPKEEKKIKSLILRLGPDYISDTVEVETSDHAKLLLKLTYSWQFNYDKNNQEDVERIFLVKDFVGDCCKSIASRIRGIVSSCSFDSFHKKSSSIVQLGVFGKDSQGNLKKPLYFKANNLCITNVDIQSQDPTDSKTREILDESMKLSMGTNIQIQEAEARHREDRGNQEAKGKVERKEIEDATLLEDKKLVLLELEARLNKGK